MCNGDGRCMKACRNRYCSKEHEEYSYKFCKVEECKMNVN